MRFVPLVCTALLLAFGALPALAQWKWKDSQGQVHVSDRPPPRDVQDKDIVQRPAATAKRAASAPATTAAAASAAAPLGGSGAASAAANEGAASAANAAAPRATTDPELAARKAKAEAEQKAKAKAEEERLAAQRRDNCQRARQHIATLQTGQRIARNNAQGEREILDDKGRAAEVAMAQRVIDSDCR